MLLPDLAKFLALDLNEKGDFIAGAAAPLAFLWLVLGYFQQGEELQQNTQALLMQGKELSLQVIELRNSVAAQNRMAAAADSDQALKAAEREERRANQKREDQPIFVFARGGAQGGSDRYASRQGFRLKNIGATTTRLYFRFSGDLVAEVFTSNRHETLASGDEVNLVLLIKLNPELRSTLRVSYQDAAGVEEWQDFEITLDKEDTRVEFNRHATSYGGGDLTC